MGIRKNKKRKEGLRLTDKKHPKQGIWATVMGILSIIIFLVLCFISGKERGGSGIGIGLAGLACAIISIWGFILAWLSLRLDNIRQLFPSLGVVINGLMVLMYLIVYILGMG